MSSRSWQIPRSCCSHTPHRLPHRGAGWNVKPRRPPEFLLRSPAAGISPGLSASPALLIPQGNTGWRAELSEADAIAGPPETVEDGQSWGRDGSARSQCVCTSERWLPKWPRTVSPLSRGGERPSAGTWRRRTDTLRSLSLDSPGGTGQFQPRQVGDNPVGFTRCSHALTGTATAMVPVVHTAEPWNSMAGKRQYQWSSVGATGRRGRSGPGPAEHTAARGGAGACCA